MDMFLLSVSPDPGHSLREYSLTVTESYGVRQSSAKVTKLQECTARVRIDVRNVKNLMRIISTCKATVIYVAKSFCISLNFAFSVTFGQR